MTGAAPDAPIRACVLGDPVAQSLSPALHGWWLAHHRIHGQYGAMQVTRAGLRDALSALRDHGYAGCNLTLPLKEAAIDVMDDIDDTARAAGAVNTVVIRDGRFHGCNSDGYGFVESLHAQAPGWSRGRAVILGAGGAARGVIDGLRRAGVGAFTLVNRTRARAQQVKADLGLVDGTVADWDARHAVLADAALVVNCTSLGMTGQPPLDLALDRLPPAAVVADIVYRPLETPLLFAARARGHRPVEGLSMLLHQGRLGFQHWFGAAPAVTPDLHAYIREKMENAP